MILGKITGKVSTAEFKFKVDDTKNTRKFDFVQIMHPSYDYVLCQIIEITRERDNTSATCNVIGYKDKESILRKIRTPFSPGSEVLVAEDKFVSEIIKIKSSEKAFIGTLEGKENIKVSLDLRKLLSKHVAILAKTGAGKSYVAGVLVEEIIEKKVPLLIIDPHGEYSQMKHENDDKKDIEKLKKMGIEPKGYNEQITEYGDIDISSDVKPLLLNEELTPRELLSILPAKLTSNQQAALYSVMKDMSKVTLKQVAAELEQYEGTNPIQIISMIDYIKNLGIFSMDYTPYKEIIRPGKCSIINLKGIEGEAQEIIVYKLLKDLFEMRKTGKVAPFFCLIEEAHNFIPEKGTGEKKSSAIIRTLAAEGRKFGLGLCVITQRPARVEKNVLSQCNTQLILKVTNPNDIKAISNSVEGITNEAEKEIPNLPIGTALVTGVSDMPFLVRTRARKSKHGGTTVDILKQDEEVDLIDGVKEYENSDILPIIDSKYSIKEIKLMNEENKEISTYLIPAIMVELRAEPSFKVLVDLIKGHIIADIAKKEIVNLKDVERLEDHQSYEKVEYKSIKYDRKLEPKVKIEAIKKKLEIYGDIKSVEECFVLYHYTK